jgi:hypothetical protein
MDGDIISMEFIDCFDKELCVQFIIDMSNEILHIHKPENIFYSEIKNKYKNKLCIFYNVRY